MKDFVESPIWRFPSYQNGSGTLPKISVTFVFATRFGEMPGDSKPLPHITLNELNDKLQNDWEVWSELVEPTQSYFSDIVRGGLGRMGRPLVVLCEHASDLEERTVVMHRPNFTEYRAESRETRLWRSDSNCAEIRWAMRDAFALFESRHLLYLLSLASIDEQLDRIDEYALIQMQKLLDPSCEASDLRDKLEFSLDDNVRRTLAATPQQPGSSVDVADVGSLVAERLRQLGTSTAKEPNGLRDVLKEYVLPKDCELRDFEWADLRSLIIALEDDEIWNVFATRKTQLQKDRRDPKDWQKEALPVGQAYSQHLDVRCACPQLYALSGFLRGILDFPHQDTSELSDALEPLFEREGDWAAFCSRQCLIEVGSGEWRSLRDVRLSLGTCPYVLLVQCVSLYRELLLSDLEKAVDLLLYGGDSKGVHAGAIVDISTILDRARGSFWPPSSKVVEDNLQGRLSIARDLLIFRPVNIFSYKMEHDLFDALTDHNEIEARTAAMVDLLDRYEGIVEDAHQVLTTAAEQRLALVLFFITAMGLIALYETVEALFGRGYDDTGDPHIAFGRIFLILAFFFAVAFIYVVWTSPHLLAIIRRLGPGQQTCCKSCVTGSSDHLRGGEGPPIFSFKVSGFTALNSKVERDQQWRT